MILLYLEALEVDNISRSVPIPGPREPIIACDHTASDGPRSFDRRGGLDGSISAQLEDDDFGVLSKRHDDSTTANTWWNVVKSPWLNENITLVPSITSTCPNLHSAERRANNCKIKF